MRCLKATTTVPIVHFLCRVGGVIRCAKVRATQIHHRGHVASVIVYLKMGSARIARSSLRSLKFTETYFPLSSIPA